MRGRELKGAGGEGAHKIPPRLRNINWEGEAPWTGAQQIIRKLYESDKGRDEPPSTEEGQSEAKKIKKFRKELRRVPLESYVTTPRPGIGHNRPPLTREEAFHKLADDQRGLPERAMLKLGHRTSGVLPYLAEHVGDLTHRMSENFAHLKGGRGTVKEKVDKTVRALNIPYGFEKEHDENLRSNYKFEVEHGRMTVPFDVFKQKVDSDLAKYANEHKKLKVYNRPQWFAREAAVALGEQNFNRARRMLRLLKDIVDNEDAYNQAVRFYHAPGFKSPTEKRKKERPESGVTTDVTSEHYHQVPYDRLFKEEKGSILEKIRFEKALKEIQEKRRTPSPKKGGGSVMMRNPYDYQPRAI